VASKRLCGSDEGDGGRTRPRRLEPRPPLEQGKRARPLVRPRREARGDGQPEQGPRGRVVGAGRVQPGAPRGAAVTEAAIRKLSALEERKAARRQPVELGGAPWGAQDDDERPGDVVGAVPVLHPRGGVKRVLEDADLVTQPEQVGERRFGAQTAISFGAAIAAASCR
jgi:hypothetical protein